MVGGRGAGIGQIQRLDYRGLYGVRAKRRGESGALGAAKVSRRNSPGGARALYPRYYHTGSVLLNE